MPFLLLFACAPAPVAPSADVAAPEAVASTVGVRIDARSDRTRLLSRRGGAVDVRLADTLPGVVTSVACVPGLASCSPGVVVEHPAGPGGAGALTEWWAEVGASVEQGWIVAERPAGAGPLRFGLALDGASDVAVLPDGGGATFRDGRGVPWLVSRLAATDAAGREVPARFELGDGLAVVVDAAGATFPVSVDPIYTAAVVALTDPHGESTSRFGSALTSGDFDGDGYGDVVASAYSSESYDRGLVAVYAGGAGGPASPPTTILYGPDGDSNGGYTIAAGDLDGDGYDDLAVGSYAFSNDQGRVDVYLGSAAGLGTRPAATLVGSGTSDFLGYRMWILPDLDGDGDAELFVVRTPFSPAPRVQWYAGGAGGILPTATATWTGASSFGTSIAGADLDGDGHVDLIIGTPTGNGTIGVYAGSASGPGTTAAVTRRSAVMFDSRGAEFGSPGDLDGDGRDDLVSMAYGTPERAEVWRGTAALLGTRSTTDILSMRTTSRGAGDLNGDGLADLVVANSLTGDGSAQVYHGRGGRVPVLLAATVTDPSGGTDFGRVTAIVPDVDGDGYDDVAVTSGEAGRSDVVYVFLGGPSTAADADGDGWSTVTDCDDADAAVNPAAVEVCNGLDDDCDGLVDQRDADAEGLVEVWRDVDRDGVGVSGAGRPACTVMPGWATSTGDCDDSDASVHPGAADPAGDGIDQDCDGDPDCCEDLDGDGVGGGEDCDDADPSVHPGAEERCNGIDDDCDGLIDDLDADLVDGITYGRDADRDNYGADADTRIACARPSGYVATLGDCDDGAGGTNPGATDTCGDGIDQDCVGGDLRCDATTYVPADAGGTVAAGSGSFHGEFVFDVTGDGVDDLVGEDDTADAWLAIPGPFTGSVDTSTATLRYDGDPDNRESLDMYCPAGDIDGDGVEDVVFYLATYGGPDGSGFYLLGGGTGTRTVNPAAATAIITGVKTVYGGGDFDGDGYTDLVGGVGFSRDAEGDSTGFAAGWAGPLAGSYSELDATFLVRAGGDVEGSLGGGPLVADLDGDGVGEVIVGAYSADAVLVYSGPVVGVLDAPDADTILWGGSGMNTGTTLTTLDHDGDGALDLAVGGNYNRGRVWVVDGPVPPGESQLATLAVATIRGTWDDEGVGDDLLGADLDLDGAGDLVIELGEGSVTTPHQGAVVALWGPLRGLGAPEDFAGLRIEHARSDFTAISKPAVGDLDGDGLPDLSVLAQTETLLFYGSQGLW